MGPGRQAGDRGHRPADQEADGDDRRRDSRRGRRLHHPARPRRASRSSAGATAPGCTSAPTCAESRRQSPGLTAKTEYADGMVEHDGHVGKTPQGARRPGHRRQHDRPLHDRQRPAHEHLARRGDDPVPQREEHQLGRGLPGALHDPLARQDQGRLGVERDHQRPRLDSDLPRRRRRAGHQGEAAQGARGRRA